MGLPSPAHDQEGAWRPCVRALGATMLVAMALMTVSRAHAQERSQPPISLYGTPGIIDTPSARFLDDGDFAATVETKQPDDRITLAFQALPWLEATARYSVVYNYFGARGPLFDRSIGFKLGLVREGQYVPAVAVGALDVGGTLIYGGEYFAAAKRFGPIDASLGLGFGRLGSRGQFSNPLGLVFPSFNNRPVGSGIVQTGRPHLSTLFHGRPVSLFGGLVYDAPIRGMKLLVEYSGDDYTQEQARGLVKIKSPVNVGISYRPVKFAEFGVDWMYGRELALRLSLVTDLKTADRGLKLDPPPPAIRVRTEEEKERGQLREELHVDDPTLAKALASDNSLLFAKQPSKLVLQPVRPAPEPSTEPAPADLAQANATGQAQIRAELSRLGMTLAKFEIQDSQAVLLVIPADGQAPLPCDEMWHQVPISGLVGIDSVTFINAAGGKEIYRCTSFINHDAPPPVPPPLRLPSPAAQASAQPSATSPVAPAPPQFQNDDDKTIADKVRRLLLNQGTPLEALKLDYAHAEAIVYFSNQTYIKVGKAIGRVVRALTQVLPPNIEIITIVETDGAINGASIQFSRSELERIVIGGGSPEELLASTSISAAEPGYGHGLTYQRSRFLRFSPLLAPGFRYNLFDPDDPFRYQFLIRVGGTLELMRGISIDGAYAINIYNDFNTIRRGADSSLPHVRSDFKYYLQKGATGIDRLQLTAIKQLAPEWTARLSAGYLEEMFGGVSGQVLYSPFDSRWAFGGELAQVWQRNYDKELGFRHYNVVTGHFSIYYATPFHHIDLKLHIGRYLAKDYGATFEISRHFDNGAEIGIFATLTNVPFHTFGEGSFDKGIRITIPFDFMSPLSSLKVFHYELRPVTRDGGAMLNSGPDLYPEVRSMSYGEAYRTWDDVLDGQ